MKTLMLYNKTIKMNANIHNNKILVVIAIAFLVPLAIVSSSCEKIYNTQWMYYNETGCSDPWKTYPGTPENDKIKAVKDYFKQKNIKIFDVEVTNDGIMETCLSCSCKSGNRIKCKVKEKDVPEMKTEGFYQ